MSFISSKQPFVTQSAGEAELVAVNKVGNYADWTVQFMEKLGFKQKPLIMYQVSECSLKMLRVPSNVPSISRFAGFGLKN